MTRRLWVLATALALAVLASACQGAPAADGDDDDGIDFVAIPAPQFAGGEETAHVNRIGQDRWRIDDALEPALAIYMDETHDSVSVEFGITVEQGEDASVVLSYSDGSYYFLGIGSFHHQFVIARQDAGQRPSILASYGLAQDIEYGVEVRVGASIFYEALRATLILTVDGQEVLDYDDYTPLPGGHIGFRSFRTMCSFRLLSGPE